MVKPQGKEMKMQWMTVDGRRTPIILPQIWDHEKEDWVVTSTENPLPTQVTGSIVEELFLEETTVPVGSDTRVVLKLKGNKVGIGLNILPTSEFSVKYEDYPNNRATSVLEEVFGSSSKVNRGSGFIIPTSKTVRLRIENNSDNDFEIQQLVVTNFM